MRGAQDLPTLLGMDLAALTDILGHSVHASQLHAALHATLTQEDLTRDATKAKGGGKVTRKGLPKFGNK